VFLWSSLLFVIGAVIAGLVLPRGTLAQLAAGPGKQDAGPADPELVSHWTCASRPSVDREPVKAATAPGHQ
jgi:hypothetical protein